MKKIFGLLAGLLLFAGCKEEQVDPTLPTNAFTLDIVKMGTRSVSVRVTPSDTGLSYIGVIMDKTSYESMKTDFCEQVVAAYKEQGVPLEALIKAGVDEIVGDYLSPGLDVVIGVFGCSAEGVISTEPVFKSFKMADVEPNLEDCTFEIDVTDIKPGSAKVHVTPSNKDLMYVVLPGSKTVVDGYGGDLLTLAQTMVQYYESEGQMDFSNVDSSESLQIGDMTINATGLLGGDDQVVICFAVNSKGEILSDENQFGFYEFKTPYPPMSNCTFEFAVSDISFNSCSVTTTPSKSYVTTYTSTVLKRYLDTVYPTVEDYTDFMNACIMNEVYDFEGSKENFNIIPGSGITEFDEVGTLVPEDEYIVFAFTAEAGRPTSELFLSEPFRAKEFVYKSGGDAEVTMEILAIRNGAMYGPSYAGFGFMDVLFHYNEECVEYFVAMPAPEDQGKWAAMGEDDLKKAVILSIGSNQHKDNQKTLFWPLDQIAPFYLVGMDKDGQFGKVNVVEEMCTLGRSMSSMLPEKN